MSIITKITKLYKNIKDRGQAMSMLTITITSRVTQIKRQLLLIIINIKNIYKKAWA